MLIEVNSKEIYVEEYGKGNARTIVFSMVVLG